MQVLPRKCIPPCFDPMGIPPMSLRRAWRRENRQICMMLPMSIRCNACGNYIHRGTKFNSRKEHVIGETYLGIQVSKFYFNCTKCSAELVMKTDPQSSNYVMEAGATPWCNEVEDEKRVHEESRSSTKPDEKEQDVHGSNVLQLLCQYNSDDSDE